MLRLDGLIKFKEEENMMIARLISASIGLVLLSSAFRWTLDPESAAAGLAMALVEGPGDTTMGMNTQIGDFTAKSYSPLN